MKIIVFGTLVTSLIIVGCAGLPVKDPHADRASSEGYFVSGDEAHYRNGVGNYAPMQCTEGGTWGRPISCDSIPVASQPYGEEDYFLKVHFNTESSRLSRRDRMAIRQWAQAHSNFREGDKVTVMISGYADSRGPSEFNDQLSLARAEAVKTEIQKCLPKAAVVTVAEGEVPGTSMDPEATQARSVEIFGDVDPE